MKTLVVSGGGSWGAFTVGRLLCKKENYDMAIGCSTGSLIAPFALLGRYELLSEAYSSIGNNDIFSINPFTDKGRFKIISAILRIVRKKLTLGEHQNLLKTIKKFYTPEIHKEIQESSKELYITVCSLTNKEEPTKYVRAKDFDYETFCMYMWASCAVPIVTNIVRIGDEEYVDGGTTEGVPLVFAVLKGGSTIDTYLHEVRIEKNERASFIADIFHLATRLWNVIRRSMRKDDLGAYLLDRYSSATVNLYYLPYELDASALFFNRDKMTEWVTKGFEHEMSVK